ncbi:MAG: glycosyltransferase family 4 protein [Planctomycetaceae bacterium]|nr:glycosyltransferase family 4 protein [Planctomycetaceae bacterium]
MRVLLINQTFHPDVAATAQHGWDLARHLVKHGHEVSAIASRSIYGQAGGALPAYEKIDGVEIHRVGRSLFGKAGTAGRAIDFALFYVLAAAKAMSIERHQVSVCFTTPPFISLLGLALRALRGTKLVYWVMDLYPDVPVATGMMRQDAPLTRVLERLNRLALRRADATVVLGRCMEDRVRAKGVAGANIVRINVWSDAEELSPVARADNSYRRAWNVGDRTLVMYSGNFGIGHDVRTFADGAKLLAARGDVMFAFVGGGKRKKELVDAMKAHGLTNFVEADYQPRERLGELLSAADVHLASMIPGWEGVMVPSKLYGTLGAARPVIWVGSESTEVARVLHEERCGLVVTPGDAEGFAAAVRTLADDAALRADMGARARRSLEERWGAPHALERWRTLIESLA